MSRGILSKAEKEKLAESRKQVAKVLERDANLSDRDLYDRLLKQARMLEQNLYEEKLADNALIHQRPAFSEVPGGYTPMPAALQQAAQGEYYHSFQGLFPQIHRAWMTIDHVLYLWDYNDPRGSFYLYDGLDQTIIHASLVRPRQGVFEPTPDWLLLLSTPVEVILLGLYTTATHDIDVFETGYSVATDGANLLQIVGTPSGRIFMAGADGFVYELTYGDSEGWFYTNKKCTKRNRSRKRDVALQYLSSVVYDSSDPILDLVYDAERSLLYTLSRASTLQLFDLGWDGEGPVRFVARLEAPKLAADLRSQSKVRDAPIYAKVDKDIKEGEQYQEGQTAFVALAPLPSALSKQLQLVITTVSGVRVYLEVVDANGKGLESAPDSPRAARLKPLYALPPPRPLKCQRGTVLNAADVNVFADELARSGLEPSHREWELLCLSDLPLLPSDRPEDRDDKSTLSRLRVPGVVLALAEDVQGAVMSATGSYELVSQHRVDQARARTFIVLTTSVAGVKRIVKRRPVDELQLLLGASSASWVDQPLDFFRRYGPDGACAMCLLACKCSPRRPMHFPTGTAPTKHAPCACSVPLASLPSASPPSRRSSRSGLAAGGKAHHRRWPRAKVAHRTRPSSRRPQRRTGRRCRSRRSGTAGGTAGYVGCSRGCFSPIGIGR
jgi:nuclear pore complex protein Nup155